MLRMAMCDGSVTCSSEQVRFGKRASPEFNQTAVLPHLEHRTPCSLAVAAVRWLRIPDKIQFAVEVMWISPREKEPVEP